jgi:hypothetical protein
MKFKYCLHITLETVDTKDVVSSKAYVSLIYFLFPLFALDDIVKIILEDKAKPESINEKNLIVRSVVRVLE